MATENIHTEEVTAIYYVNGKIKAMKKEINERVIPSGAWSISRCTDRGVLMAIQGVIQDREGHTSALMWFPEENLRVVTTYTNHRSETL